MKYRFVMSSENKFVCECRYLEMAYLKYRRHENEIFAFISIRYTITNIQTPYTH